MPQIDVLDGLTGNVAVKYPCRAKTIGNITLSGFKTVDTIVCADGDSNLRILVGNQINPIDNGVWDMSSGAWTRAKDFNGSRDIASGTLVRVNGGATQSGYWIVSSDDPIVIGSSDITFTRDSITSDSITVIHTADGSGAVPISVHDLIELDSVSYFKYMTEVERNDVIGGTYSIDVSGKIQDAIDHAATTQRIVKGYGMPRIESKITLRTSFISYAGGMFEGSGTVFKWFGSGDRVFELPVYVQGWIFERFRADLSNVISDAVGFYCTQGLRACTMRNVEVKGYYNAGTYANHDFMKVIGGSGGTKYDMSQNLFEQIAMFRCRNGIEVTDPSGQGPGNGNKIDGLIALCNGFVVKLPGSSNKFINNEVYVDTGSGGHAYILDGQFAYGWSFDVCDFDGALGTAGWEPIHANTAGSVSLCSFDGGINSIRSGNKPDLVLDAGTSGKQKRYSVINMNNEDSTTYQVNALTTGQGITTNNRTTFDSNMVDYVGTATLTGSGAMTLSGVTLAPCQFEKTGKMMTVIAKAAFTVGGTPSSTVSLSLPASTNAAINSGAMPIWIFNGGTWSIGAAFVTSSGTAINCFVDNSATAWTAGSAEVNININIPIL